MPEEINRILTDRISDWLFCPTDTAINNLKKEGYENMPCQIIKTGDVMEDAAIFYGEKASEKSTILNQLSLTGKSFILSTIHRAENTDNLINLKGCPRIITCNFDCSQNKLTTLLEGPKMVFRQSWYSYNNLLSLDYIPFNRYLT